MESPEVDVQDDPVSGFQYLSAHGFHVVMVGQLDDVTLERALSLVSRLRGSNPLDVGMLVFKDEVRVPASLVNHLGGLCVMVSRLRADNVLTKARVEVARYLELCRQGSDNLARFLASTHEGVNSFSEQKSPLSD